MNLEEKSRDYVLERVWSSTPTDSAFKAGGKWVLNQFELMQKANPKMSASDLVKELKKLL